MRPVSLLHCGPTDSPIVYCRGHQVAHDCGPTLAVVQRGHEITVDALAKSRRWTADELAELKRLSHHTPVEEIAAALGRTVSGIRTKAAQKRIVVHHTGPKQGPPRLRLPWEPERDT